MATIVILLAAAFVFLQSRTDREPPQPTTQVASALSTPVDATPVGSTAVPAISTKPAETASPAPSPTPSPTATNTASPTLTPTATSSPTAVRPAAALAWANTSDELRVWDPVAGQSSLIDSVAGQMQWEWAPGGGHIAYQGADRDLYIAEPGGEKRRIRESASFDWSPDGGQLAYLDRSNDRCVLRLVKPDGSDDRVLADLTRESVGDGGMGGGAEDFVVRRIIDQEPYDADGDDGLWWTGDGGRIVVVTRMGGMGPSQSNCRSAVVDTSGGVTPCSEEYRCPGYDEPPSAMDLLSDSSPAVLRDADDAFWRFGYLGANIDYKYPSATGGEATDAELRARLPNWGFHNNLWLRSADGAITRPLTDNDTFKWLGAWSPDGEWLAFAELVATEGEVFDFGGALAFDAKTAIDLWLLSPAANQLTQVSSSGDLATFAWQPLPARSGAAPTLRARVGAAGNFQAPQLPVVPDGRFDEWSGPWEPLLAEVQGTDQRSGTEDASARFRTAWDARGLYVAVQVTDDSYLGVRSGEGMAGGDSIEINLDRDLAGDFDDAASSADDYRIVISFGKQGEGVYGYRWLPAGEKGPLVLTATVVATPGGYDLEALIPWEAFNLAGGPVREATTFGFNLAVNDYDAPEGTAPTVLSTSPGRVAPDNPTQWGTLRLAAPPGSSG